MAERAGADRDERARKLQDAPGRSDEYPRLAESVGRIGTYEHDFATGLSVWSEHLKQIVGVRDDGPVDPQTALLPRVHPDDRAVFLDTVARSLAEPGCAEHDIEFRIIRDDGEVRWLRDAGSVMFTESHGERRPVRALGSVIDLTPQKLADDAARRYRREMEQHLARSRAIVRQMTEGLVIFDTEGNLLDINPAALAMYGFESVASLRRHLLGLADIFDYRDMNGRPVDVSEWPIARALRGETFKGLEVSVRCRVDGRTWIGSFGGTPVRDAEGKLEVAIVTVRDVTAEREAQAALARVKARMDVALTVTEAGLWHWEAEHGRVTADANLLRLFGLAGQERALPLEHFLACIHPHDRDRVQHGIETAGAGSYDEEYRIVHADGQVRWIHARGRVEPADRGAPASFSGIAVDVTERKAAEQALHRSEQRYRLLFENMSEGFALAEMIRDEQGTPVDWRYLEVNEAWAQTGVPVQETVGRTARDVNPDIEPYWIETFAHVVETGQPVRYENYAAGFGKWFETFAFRHSGDRFALLFRDVTERKQDEQALRRANALLGAITGETEDMIAAEDAEFRYLFFNRAYQREFRRLWGREIAVGTSMIEALAPWPEEQRKARDLWGRALRGERFSVSMEFGAAERGRQVYDLHFNPIHDDQGRPIGAAHTLRNVTERIRAQQALRESEKFLRRVLDQLFAFVGVLDCDGTLLEANRAPLEAAGIRAADVLGRKFWDCYWWSYSPEIQARLKEATARARDGEVVRFDVPVRVAEDRRLWIDFQLAPLRDGDGRITHLIPSAMDITARLQAEDARRRSDARYGELLQNANSAILRWTRDGSITFFNEYAERLFGYSAEEIVGRHIGLLVPDRESTGRDLSGLVADAVSHPERYERHVNENLCRDGRRLWMIWTNKSVFDEQGRFSEMLCVGTDITRLKNAEAALREADRRKDEFLATLAHELRNPLAPIRTGVDLLLHGSNHPSATAQALAMMDRQLANLVRLVDDLLDVSRISRGKITLQREQLDLADVVESALEMSESGIARGNRRLTVTLPPEPLPIHGDRVRLAQVLANLLNNAAKFTGEDGRIEILAERLGDQVRISVRDDGIGIAPERLSDVFEPFSQVQDGQLGGLGIGLTLVRRLVEMHDGSVSAHSDGPGRGAEFTISMPLGTAPRVTDLEALRHG